MTVNPIISKSLIIIIPFIIGLFLSSVIWPQQTEVAVDNGNQDLSAVQELDSFSPTASLSELTFAIHRNGEASACGTTITDLEATLVSLLPEVVNKNGQSNADILRSVTLPKHKVDQLLTAAFGQHLLSNSSCGPETPPESVKGIKRKDWGRGEDYTIDGVDSSFLTFCDMGEERTPILHDHDQLTPVISENNVKTFPCHFHTREGLRITSLQQLIGLSNTVTITNSNNGDCQVSTNGDQTCQNSNIMHLYAVPAGRIFMFAPAYVGEVFTLSHVQHPQSAEPVKLQVLSVSPRVFDVLNFFDEKESQAIVDKAMKETSETHRIKRSSTGATGYNVNSQRTSENGFDTHGTTAILVKKRSLEMLGFDEYIESYTDGLQVLRYNKTTAYIPHMDWIDDPGKRQRHNFDSSRLGTNRFATVLLYMTNLEEGEGGETVFKNAWPNDVPEEERVNTGELLNQLRANGEVSSLEENSWEETMVVDCRSRLAVRPHAGRAVLFYSQHPNGEEDKSSLHGGCPVLSGTKWAANNWIWNGPRGGFPGSPVNEGKEDEEPPGQLQGVFSNTGKDPKFNNAKLYFQETEWGDFRPGQTHRVNTYHGHEWKVKDANGSLLQQWLVAASPKQQDFIV